LCQAPVLMASVLQLFHWQRARFFGKTAVMKRFSLVIALTLGLASSSLFAQGKIDLQASDTILSILQKNTGQTVELRMKSGEKIAGKVEKIGIKLVHLSQLTGAEFFDAVVDAEDVAAVIVRVKSK
jgi:hypothetical protein